MDKHNGLPYEWACGFLQKAENQTKKTVLQ